MSSNQIAVSVSNLGKCYQIYDRPQDRLKQSLVPRMRRLFGQSAPNYYREFWALREVSFEILKGETIGIIGRNGSGKSTLLQLICGTLSPTSGTVETVGRVAALLELGSGFNPEFTGRENVYLNGSVLGMSQDAIDARFDDIARFADIGQFIEQPVKTYSSGMMVRLAFAVIAHVDPDVLIVDEALAVGDAVFVQKCNRFIRDFVKKGTLLFVSHSMQSILDLCDRSLWLRDGVVCGDGTAIDVVRDYNAYVHQQITADKTVSVVKKAYKGKRDEPSGKETEVTKLLSESNHKFRITLFGFDFNSAYWGVGGAEIVHMDLRDESGEIKNTLEGCGTIEVRVHCRARVDLSRPIVGISLRNHRGVELISENSNLTYYHSPPPAITQNTTFRADFKFFLPYLPTGEYSFGAAIADGTQDKFVQLHRRDDALRFTVLSSHLVYGMFGMPLKECRIVPIE